MMNVSMSAPDDDASTTPSGIVLHRSDGRRPGRRTTWPPPALESARGGVWSTIAWLTFGAALLVMPLIAVISAGAGFRDPVPFYTGWWLLGMFGVTGTVATIEGARRLVRLLLAGARAAGQGCGLLTFAAVAVDGDGDTGRLVRGEPPYAALGAGERAWQVGTRVAAGAALLLAAVWLPVAFALSVRLAAHGRLAPSGVRLATLAPAALFVLCAVVCRAFDHTLRRHARRTARASDRPDAAKGGAGAEADTPADRATAPASDVPPAGPVLGAGAFRVAAAAVALIMALAVGPLVGLVAASTAAPAIAQLVMPRWFADMQRKVAAAEAMRSYRLAPDSAISPEVAGAALHTLASVGRSRDLRPVERAPARIQAQAWFPADARSILGMHPERYAADLFPLVVGDGLDAEQREVLAQVAAHPAQREFRLVARAPAADVLGARWTLPLPDTLTAMELPMPFVSRLRSAVYARFAKAALELDGGRTEAAERTVREAISLGFLVLDEGPTLIDALIGAVDVNSAGRALESLYRATGRTDEARAVAHAREAAERAATVATAGSGRRSRTTAAALADLPPVIAAADVPRGLRWELLGWFNTIGVCADGRRLVFGPGDGYEAWLEDVRESLVRTPAEADLFELFRRGHLTAKNGSVRHPGWGVAAMRWAVGRDEAGRCGQLVNGVVER